jgi:hypothetical protein
MKPLKKILIVTFFLIGFFFTASFVYAVNEIPEPPPPAGAPPAGNIPEMPTPAPVGDTCVCNLKITGQNCNYKAPPVQYPVEKNKSPREIMGEPTVVLPNTCPIQRADYPVTGAAERWPMSLDKCDGHSYTQKNAQQYEFSIECFGKKPDEAPALDTRTPPEGYREGKKTGIAGILPDCAFYAYGCGDGGNANIDIFIKLAINIGKVIFSMIGTVAFVMFVYGGFTMILAFGSSDKFKKGQGILVAAVIGMMISFSAYLIVQFILNALNVGADFKIL